MLPAAPRYGARFQAGGSGVGPGTTGQVGVGLWWRRRERRRALTTLVGVSRSHRILGLAVPAMGALAADPLLGLVDTAFVGRLGTPQLAALGIDTAIFTTTFVVFNFLTYGTTAEVARLVGAGHPRRATQHVVQAVILSVAFGILVTAVLLLATQPVLDVMGASGAVVDPAATYLRVRALAAVPVLVVQASHGAFRGLSDTRTPLWVTIGANTVNAALSWLLIFPAGLGVAGAAWGTVVAQSMAALVFLRLLRRRLPDPVLRFEPVAARHLLVIGRDLFVRTVGLVAGLAVVTALAARMGTVTVAAHQVARELWLFMVLVLDGFAIAGQAMVGTALGAGRRDELPDLVRELMWWGLGSGAVLGLGYLAAVGPLPFLFTSDPEVVRTVRRVWWLVALLQPIGGVVFVLDGVFMGAAEFRYLAATTLAAVAVLVGAALAAAAFDGGLLALWGAMAALMVVRLGTMLAGLPRLTQRPALPSPP